LYSSLFFQIPPPKHPWFYRLSIPKDQIVAADQIVCRLRANHYNFNYSLHRKNIVVSPSCPCGDPRQDINHIIFRCSLYREKSLKLRQYLSLCNPLVYQDLFPSLKSPKLCRLIVSSSLAILTYDCIKSPAFLISSLFEVYLIPPPLPSPPEMRSDFALYRALPMIGRVSLYVSPSIIPRLQPIFTDSLANLIPLVNGTMCHFSEEEEEEEEEEEDFRTNL